MPKHTFFLFFLFALSSAILSGCATKPTNEPPIIQVQHNAVQRAALLTKINQWSLRGKIAFIEQLKDQKSKRQSANIAWQVNETNQTQELNLTSYLGINVLHLSSEKNNHLIKVDAKEYKANNLTQLVYSLTGLTLPTKALNFWLKGLPYQPSDQLELSSINQLPITLTSQFDNVQWQINYGKYQLFDDIQMATDFTIKKDGLLIKLAIKKWSLIH